MTREAYVAIPVSREMLDSVIDRDALMADLRKQAARKFEQLGVSNAPYSVLTMADEPTEMPADEVAELFPYLADRDDIVTYKWTAVLA